MLKLNNICKSFKTADFVQKALDDVSIEFRKNEFVAILGPSGSGKTTLLNIIGGLDHYDSGDLVINSKSTKDFKDRDWDAYRNNCIGFVFQNYNLISHISILSNVEMSMTLSGVGAKERKKRAMEALEKVGLKEHMNKKPNQLSGGQMQRVAIARALVNNPDIIMADEPTGALDSKTSVQIMELIKEIAKDKLVIMVTHNPELAKDYATRIVELKDGHIISDSNPVNEKEREEKEYTIGKTAMSFFSALNLSFNNIKTKKGRTFLTAFASSIGIIGIAIILSLSNGFQLKIDEYIKDTMDQFPIIITESTMEVDSEMLEEQHQELTDIMLGNVEYPDTQEVALYDSSLDTITHTNVMSDEYISYLEAVDKDVCSSIGYINIISMNAIRKTDDKVVPVSFATGVNNTVSYSTSGMTNMSVTTYPKMLDENTTYLEEYYDILSGAYPKLPTEVVLVVDNKNRIDEKVMKGLGFETEDIESIKFEDIIGTEMQIVSNNDFYEKGTFGNFVPKTNYDSLYDLENNITIKIVGIVRSKKDVKISLLAGGIAYSNELSNIVYEKAKDSDIVKDQMDSNLNLLTMQEFKTDKEKDQMIAYLGGSKVPVSAIIYPTTFENKEKLIEYLDEYNDGKEKDDKVVYTDLSETITTMTSGIMDAITIVLIAFSAISLVVSTIMIAIITYISVLERTKEIGILRALGARNKDITRVFNAETFIIGLFSGLIGIVVAGLLTIPANSILLKLTELENVAQLKIEHALLLVTISVILTLIGGFIPAKIAAKKDPVEALRTE